VPGCALCLQSRVSAHRPSSAERVASRPPSGTLPFCSGLTGWLRRLLTGCRLGSDAGIWGRGHDRITIRETARLNGEDARAVLQTHIADKDATTHLISEGLLG